MELGRGNPKGLLTAKSLSCNLLKASGIHLLFYLKFIRIANRLIFVNNLHAGHKKKGSLLQVNADFSLKKKINAGSKEWEGKSDFAHNERGLV